MGGRGAEGNVLVVEKEGSYRLGWVRFGFVWKVRFEVFFFGVRDECVGNIGVSLRCGWC